MQHLSCAGLRADGPACTVCCWLACCVHSQNIDDAMAKLQQVLDDAVIAVTPKEIDPETIKRVKAK